MHNINKLFTDSAAEPQRRGWKNKNSLSLCYDLTRGLQHKVES